MVEEGRSDSLPHNPWVRELVAGKQRWSSRPRHEAGIAGFTGWHERGYLPHRDEPGLVQFVTFHTADSFPASLRSEWMALLSIEDRPEKRRRLEHYLDRGRGERPLSIPHIGRLVDEALRFYDGAKYELRAWVVMPNHVHFLFKAETEPMGKVIRSLKEFTARRANRYLGRKGQFWAADFYDTYMRNADQELRVRRYIEANPVKALLSKDAKDWPWSSARYRDEYGRLHI